MIILPILTRQPDIAPERFVIENYDIDDYLDKTEMTTTRLYTTVRSAVKAYRDLWLIDFNRRGLERLLDAVPTKKPGPFIRQRKNTQWSRYTI
jgi:hypothetical protein